MPRARTLVAVLGDGQKLCDDCHGDYRRDHPLDDGSPLSRYETGVCDYHPEEDIITRKEREALDAQEAEESIRNTSREAMREEIDRLRRQREGLRTSAPSDTEIMARLRRGHSALKEITFGSRYCMPLNAEQSERQRIDWQAVFRSAGRIMWMGTHPFSLDLASCAETNS